MGRIQPPGTCGPAHLWEHTFCTGTFSHLLLVAAPHHCPLLSAPACIPARDPGLGTQGLQLSTRFTTPCEPRIISRQKGLKAVLEVMNLNAESTILSSREMHYALSQ